MKTESAPSDAAAESLLAELVDEITQRLNAGELVTLEQYTAAYPQFADTLARLWEALTLVRQPGVTGGGLLFDENAEPCGQLGDFHILREIGRGGMGVVYEVAQISLGRHVALKVLPFAAMLGEQQLRRFKNEARAAATLKHPNIVSVYSVGCERGVHYYAMELVDGESLDHVLKQLSNQKSNSSRSPTRDAQAASKAS